MLNKKFFKLALILAGIVAIATVGWYNFREQLTTDYQISEIAHQQFNGPKELVISPVDGSHFGIGGVTPETPARVEMSFKQPVELNGFSLLFYGNLHAVSAYVAEDFDVEYQLPDDSWRMLDQVREYKSPTYQANLPERTSVKGFALTLKKATFANQVEMGNVQFFTQEKVSLIDGLQSLFNRHQKSIAVYIMYPLFFTLLVYVSGYTIVHQLNKRYHWKLNPEETLVYGTAIYLGILAILAVLFIFTGFAPILYFYLVISCVAIFLFIKNHLYQHIVQLKFILSITFIALIIMTMAQAKRDFLYNFPYIEPYYDTISMTQLPLSGGFYGYHADNLRPWFISRILLSQVSLNSDTATTYLKSIGDTSIFERTPLLAVITMPILKVFGTSHFIYQRWVSVLVAFYIIAAYMAVRQYVTVLAARVATVMLLLQIPIIFQVYSVEIYLKYIAIYPILLAVIALRRSPAWLVGVLLAAGFLVHPMVIILIAAVVTVYFKHLSWNRRSVIQAIPVIGIPAAFLAVWWYLSRHVTLGTTTSATAAPANLYLIKLLSWHPRFWVDKFANLGNLLVPDILKRTYPHWITLDYLRIFLRNSLIAAISPLLFLFGITKLSKRHLQQYGELLWLAGGPLLIFFLLLHEYSLGGFETLYPFCLPFLFAFIVQQLASSQRWRRVLLLLSYISTMAVVIYLDSGIMIVKTFQYSSEIVRNLIWGLLTIFVGLSLILIKLAWSSQTEYAHD